MRKLPDKHLKFFSSQDVYSIQRRLRLGSLETTHKQGQRVLRTQMMQSIIIPSSAADESHMPRLLKGAVYRPPPPNITTRGAGTAGRQAISQVTIAPADRFKRNSHVAQRTNPMLTSTNTFWSRRLILQSTTAPGSCTNGVMLEQVTDGRDP